MSRQAATPAATLSAVMLKNIDNQTIDGEEKSKPEMIKLGLDLHARQCGRLGHSSGSSLRALRREQRQQLRYIRFLYIVNLRADLTSEFFSDIVPAAWGPALATHEQFRPDFVLQIVNLPTYRGCDRCRRMAA